MQVFNSISPFNWFLSKRSNLLAGLIIGAVSFVAAVHLVPQTVKSCGEHDQMLAVWLGLIYAPLTLLWFRKVTTRIPFGIVGTLVAGILAGAFYAILCLICRNFLLIMVVFPGLFACLLSLLIQLNEEDRLLSPRTLSICRGGLRAGFVAGAVYAAVLNIGSVILYFSGIIHIVIVQEYAKEIATYGPITFALASAIFYHYICRFKSS